MPKAREEDRKKRRSRSRRFCRNAAGVSLSGLYSRLVILSIHFRRSEPSYSGRSPCKKVRRATGQGNYFWNKRTMTQEKSPLVEEQHFAPQFYLRRFLNQTSEVEVLDCKQRKIIRPRGTKGICSEKYYYGLSTGEPDEVSQELEKYFRDIEDWIAKNLDGIVGKLLHEEHISEPEKWVVALLMSMIWSRGPFMRNQIKRMQETAMKHLISFQFSHPSVDSLLDKIDKDLGRTPSSEERAKLKEIVKNKSYSLESSNYQHLVMLEKMRGFANLFCGQDWEVYISKSDKKFVTSDNPVATYIPEREGFYPPTFLERTHYFVLTPDICIHARYSHKRSGKKLRRKTLFKNNDHVVLDLNRAIAARAYNYIYSLEKGSLEEMLTVIRQVFPTAASPELRQRDPS